MPLGFPLNTGSPSPTETFNGHEQRRMSHIIKWWRSFNQKIVENSHEEEGEQQQQPPQAEVESPLTLRVRRSSSRIPRRPWQHIKILLAMHNKSSLHLENRSWYGFFPLERYNKVFSNMWLINGTSGRLKALTFDRANISIKAATVLGKVLSCNETIETLKFTKCDFQSGSFSSLVDEKFMSKSLKTLWIKECLYDTQQFAGLVDGILTAISTTNRVSSSLNELNLSNNICPSEGVDALCRLLEHTPLKGSEISTGLMRLDLSNMNFSHRTSARKFASKLPQSLANNQTVYSLNLDGIFFTDDDLKILADAIRTNSTLKELSLLPNDVYPYFDLYLSDDDDDDDIDPENPAVVDALYGIEGMSHLIPAVDENLTLESLKVSVCNPPPEMECNFIIQNLERSLKYFQVVNRCGRHLVQRNRNAVNNKYVAGACRPTPFEVCGAANCGIDVGTRCEDNDIPAALWPHILERISGQTAKATVWNRKEIDASAMYYFLRNKILLEN